jgi:hypothetical protein
MRSLVCLSLAVVAVANGCSDGPRSPTAPLTPLVRFDSLTTVSVNGQAWQAFAVSNLGNATAFRVKVYWHFTTSQDTARASLTQPPDLAKGQDGLAATTMMSNINWYFPTAPDSIRWSVTP